MKDKKDKKWEMDSQKIAKIVLKILSGLVQKFSIGLILETKKQIENIIFQIKKGILAGFFAIFGFFFLLIGLAIFLESLFSFFPGSGYLAIGGGSVILALLIALFKNKQQ